MSHSEGEGDILVYGEGAIERLKKYALVFVGFGFPDPQCKTNLWSYPRDAKIRELTEN